MQPIRIDRCPHCNWNLRERSIEQNGKLHALLSDIARQQKWNGQFLDLEAWKRLFVSAWERANQRPAEFYPALDGQGFDVVYRRTSRMNKKEVSELIEYVTAWAIDKGINLREEAHA
jgi:hypothetical protein